MYKKVTNDAESKRFCELYNQAQEANDFPYIPLNQEEFSRLFVNDTDEIKRVFLADEEHEAFISGAFDTRNGKRFVTFVFVPEEKRRQSIASKLLEALEAELLQFGNLEEKKIEISFFNPSNLRWYIPNTEKHEHPNAPGIEVGSPAFYFFKNNGYRTFANQNAYHLDLAKFEMPEAMRVLEDKLKEEGITFAIYDKETMSDFDYLLEDLNSEIWSRDLHFEISDEGQNRPIIVPLDGNKVIGFTGPLDLIEDGRGYFQGIAVHSAYRGKGIAKVLFNHLCLGLKEIGASYITLFTGEQNPGRNIYEATGFRVAKSFEDMRKERFPK